MNPETKACKNCKQNFTIESEDFDFYEKIKVPPPTFCPGCRLQRRIMWRNESTLYSRACDLCKKKVISIYSPEVPFPVYCLSCYNSDVWDPFSFGKEYDHNKNFFAQMKELLTKVPQAAVRHIGTVSDSPYSNLVFSSKDVYLSSSVLESEYVYYSNSVDYSKNVLDSFNVKKLESCYENFNSEGNFKCFYTFYSRNCIESRFIIDCVNCQNCFMCFGLRNKSYCYYNEQLTPQEYKERVSGATSSYMKLSKLLDDFENLYKKGFYKFANIVNGKNATGDNIKNSTNITSGFDVYDSENVKYARRVVNSKDSQDVFGIGPQGELLYENVTTSIGTARTLGSFFIDSSHDVTYSLFSSSSSNLFGCIGLRSSKYCILNKQYSEEEYKNTIAQIIKDMQVNPYVDAQDRVFTYGDFFPYDLSSFAYNETVAQDYFPLSESEAIKKGFKWHVDPERSHTPTLLSQNIPDSVENTTDSILNEAVECLSKGAIEKCTDAFKITNDELGFYKANNLPIPRFCPNCRYFYRMKKRNPLKLWHRSCMCDLAVHEHEGKCVNEFETSYAPERAEKVYCESCYQKEVL